MIAPKNKSSKISGENTDGQSFVSDVNNRLAEFVQQIASEKELSYRDIEARSGNLISHSTVSLIMNKKLKNITTYVLTGLAKGLGVSDEEVFAVAFGQIKTRPAIETENTELTSLFRAINELPQEDILEMKPIWKMLQAEVERRKSTHKKKTLHLPAAKIRKEKILEQDKLCEQNS